MRQDKIRKCVKENREDILHPQEIIYLREENAYFANKSANCQKEFK